MSFVALAGKMGASAARAVSGSGGFRTTVSRVKNSVQFAFRRLSTVEHTQDGPFKLNDEHTPDGPFKLTDEQTQDGPFKLAVCDTGPKNDRLPDASYRQTGDPDLHAWLNKKDDRHSSHEESTHL